MPYRLKIFEIVAAEVSQAYFTKKKYARYVVTANR